MLSFFRGDDAETPETPWHALTRTCSPQPPTFCPRIVFAARSERPSWTSADTRTAGGFDIVTAWQSSLDARSSSKAALKAMWPHYPVMGQSVTGQ
ncbi:hypothetical protein PsYK624_090120 [Phanerochaete sordida]|uniref:Uncharacterized protein n=1 Tax=Phanerochaete sordida TaxID=48140 RepID=A0A9P3GFP3_9APHY|nr:hypothetical protein PsYK624_090120 [Phanerochaete sordida]